jgi:hypothetical protein
MSVLSSNAPVVTPPITSSGGKELGKEETIELLGEETSEEEKPLELTETPKKGKKEDNQEDEESDGETEEVDELKEIEEELEEPDEEKLELMTPVRRREILKKYPTLFKDFPYLERAYYRDQQFTEILPTLQDAKAAVEKASAFDNFERHLLDGNIGVVFDAMKKEDTPAFHKIVDELMPSLLKTDAEAYYHVVSGVLKDTLVTMVREARSTGSEALENAAKILNQFAFGTAKFVPHQRLSKQSSPEESTRENELAQEREQILKNQYDSVHSDLQTRADNVLKATIDQHIDPKQSMTDYVRRHASSEAMRTLEDLMSKDRGFRVILDKLWERSFEQKFSKESTDRIKSAYLAKAKTLLPTVIKKARNEALRGLGKQVREEEETSEQTETQTRNAGPKKPAGSSSGKIKSAKDVPRGMSTFDALNAMD